MYSLQLLSLDCAIGFYPLVLIIVTYKVIDLHERNFKTFVWLWRPFIRCLVQVRRVWDIRSSIIEAFATFLILSYLRFMNVSFNILVPTWVLVAFTCTTMQVQSTALCLGLAKSVSSKAETTSFD